MKTTVVYHSSDFDGLFCREIARKFLPDANLIGWDFGDEPISLPDDGRRIVVMDLPLDAPFGLKMHPLAADNKATGFPDTITWIDHHASSIASHPKNIPGYRIDGVAACRLAWQWFAMQALAMERPCQWCGAMAHPAKVPYEQGEPCPHCGGIHFGSSFCPYTEDSQKSSALPTKQDFIDRTVSEPLAVRLAGEYDIWDKRDPNAELFQHGLRSVPLTDGVWDELLEPKNLPNLVEHLLENGKSIQYSREQEYRDVITQQGFDVQFEGHCYLACNSHELDIRSQLFEAGIKPHHDGLLGFTFNGKDWRVSLYGIPGKDIDHSKIAVKHGGGGHKNACGFRAEKLPFLC